jgi:hypothetical protein
MMLGLVNFRDEPLSKGVLAVNMSLGWFKRPTDFEKVWSSEGGNSVTGCSIWKPICPTGYVSLGCVAMQGVDPPPRSSVACVKERVVTSSSWMDCILFERFLSDNPMLVLVFLWII